MKFQIGDKVRFLNEKGEAVVTQIVNNKMLKIAIEEGFEIPVSVEELVLIQNGSQQNNHTTKESSHPSSPKMRNEIYEKQKNTKLRKDAKAAIIQKQKIKRDILDFATALTTEEVDLHIEELLDDYKGMSNAEIVIVQLQHFQKRLDRALFNNQHKIIFIHGVGNGTLKREIRNILKTYNRINFQDADIRRYGLGATEVEIK